MLRLNKVDHSKNDENEFPDDGGLFSIEIPHQKRAGTANPKHQHLTSDQRFEIAYENTRHHEGGYRSKKLAETSDDTGGETYMGIARNYNPDWEGWKVIDKYRETNELKFNTTIDNPELTDMVKSFYKTEHWDKNNLDSIDDIDTAGMIFDMSVNNGRSGMAGLVDKALNENSKKNPGKLSNAHIEKINSDYSLHDEIAKKRLEKLEKRKKSSDNDGLKNRANSFKRDEIKKRNDKKESKRLQKEIREKIQLDKSKGNQQLLAQQHNHDMHVCTGADCTNILHNIQTGVQKLLANLS